MDIPLAFENNAVKKTTELSVSRDRENIYSNWKKKAIY